MGGGERGRGSCGDGLSADKDQISFDNNLNTIWRHTGAIEAGGKSSDNKDGGFVRKCLTLTACGALCCSAVHLTDTFWLKTYCKIKQKVLHVYFLHSYTHLHSCDSLGEMLLN